MALEFALTDSLSDKYGNRCDGCAKHIKSYKDNEKAFRFTIRHIKRLHSLINSIIKFAFIRQIIIESFVEIFGLIINSNSIITTTN